MVTTENIENQKKEFIDKLTTDELRGYIDTILKKYYNGYLKGNIKDVNSAIDDINEIIEIATYSNIENYINYRLVIMGNKTLKSVLNKNNNLYYPNEVLIDNNVNENFNSLFDESLMRDILIEERMRNITEFIDFVKSLEKNENLKNVPSEFYNRVRSFIIDAKNGKYDYCLI